MDREKKAFLLLKQALSRNQISGIYGQDIFDSYQNHQVKQQSRCNYFYFLKTQTKIPNDCAEYLTNEMKKLFEGYLVQVGKNFDGFFHYLIYYITDDLTDAYILGYFDHSHLVFGLKKEGGSWNAIDDRLYTTKLDYFENDHKFIPFYRRLIDLQVKTLFSLLKKAEDELFVKKDRYADAVNPIVQSNFKASKCLKYVCFYYDHVADLVFDLNANDWGTLFDSFCYIPLFDFKNSYNMEDLYTKLPIGMKRVYLQELGKIDPTLVDKLSEMIK